MSLRLSLQVSTLVFLGLLLLGACSPAAVPPDASPEIPPTFPAMPTDQLVVPTPGENLALVWQRSGGIAGICHILTIDENGAYALQGCDPGSAVQTGALSPDQMAQLNELLDRYASFEWESIPPPNSADMFQESLTFYGRGDESPSPEEQQAISQYLGTLADELLRGSDQL